MLLLLIVFCVFCCFPITGGVTFNSTTASLETEPTSSFKKLISRNVRDFPFVQSNNTKLIPRPKRDLPSKQHDQCICTSFSIDSNRLVNGVEGPIRVWKGQTAVLHCNDPEMNLVWKNFEFTAKTVNMTCNDCRPYTPQEIPSCQAVQKKTDPVVRCTRFSDEDLNHLIVHYDDNDISVGSTANFSCKDNAQELCGKSESVCRRNGNWSSPPPQCKDPVVRCTRFSDEDLKHLIVHYDDNDIRVGSTAYFSCMDINQELSGKHESVCRRNGKWSSTLPKCHDPVVRCTRFSDEDLNLLNVHYNDNDISVGSTATFSCKDNDNKELSGKNESVCNRNGKWTSPPPQCKDLCPVIDENEAFAILYSNGRNINSRATFYCKDTKFVIQGDHIKMCLPTGQWSAANFTCRDPVVRCARFSDEDLNLLNVHYNDNDIRVGSTATFSCKDNDNKELSGKNESVCHRNGKWTSPPPQCKDLCPPIDENEVFDIVYSNGRNLNSTATFYCKDTNLLIQGDRITTCLPTGEWSAANTTCTDPVVRCTRFSDEDLKLLTVQYDGNDIRAGSTAHFTCKYNDRVLSGKIESVCLGDGKWSSPPPQCAGCGIRLDDDRSQVLYNGEATEGAWPWMVAIMFDISGDGNYDLQFHGVLIDRRHVLYSAGYFYYTNVSLYQARIGRVNGYEGDIYNISRIAVHKDNRPGIAILTLARQVTTPGYNAICLPDEGLSQKDLVGKEIWAAGWYRFGGDPGRLHQIQGRIMDVQECIRTSNSTYSEKFINGKYMCIKYPEYMGYMCLRKLQLLEIQLRDGTLLSSLPSDLS